MNEFGVRREELSIIIHKTAQFNLWRGRSEGMIFSAIVAVIVFLTTR